MSLNIATNVSFEDENEGDGVDSKANVNGTANAFETKVINDGHPKQEVTDAVALPLTAEYSQNLDTFETSFLKLKAALDLQNSIKQLLSSRVNLLTPLLNFLGTKNTSSKIGQKA